MITDPTNLYPPRQNKPFQNVWHWFTAPSLAIDQTDGRRRARLLATILITLIPLYIIPELIRAALVGNIAIHFWATSILLVTAYFFSRTQYFRFGIAIMLAVFTLLPVGSILLLDYEGSELLTAVIWVIPTLFLSILILPNRQLAFFISVNLLLIMILPLVKPTITFQDILYPFGFILVCGTFLYIIAVSRQQHMKQIESQAIELAQSETLFRSIVEHSQAGITQVGGDFRFLYVNDRLCQITGYSRDEMVGRDFRTVLDEESRQTVADYYLRRQAGQEVPSRYEFNVLRKNGEIRPVEISAATYPDEFGNLQTAAQILDITHRRRMEVALRESEALYQSLVNSLPQNIFRKDVDGRFTFVNQHFCRSHNKSAEELIGKNDFEVHPAELAKSYRVDDQFVMETGQTFETVEIFQPLGGPLSYVRTVKTPTYDVDGRLTGIQGIFWDITEIRQAQEALSQSEAKNRALSESTFEALFFSEKGYCIECNQAAVEMFGYRYDELIGSFGTDVIAEESKELVRKNILSGYEKPYEAIAQRKDGSTFPAEFHGKMYEYEGRMVRVTAVHDITDRIKAKAALQKAHDELEKRVQERTQQIADANEQLKKLDELKNKFIGDLSHELRTPLANLNLYLDLLDMGKPEKRQIYLAALRQATSRITRISEDVLAMIHLELFKEDIQFKPISLNILVTKIIRQQLKLAEEKGLDLIFVSHPQHPLIQADESKICHCLNNLITNSINYTAHGQIEINVKVDEKRQQICVEVADTGTGIEPEDLPYLFDRFYRGRQIGQSSLPGSGLGLALVKEIVEIHGGSVEAENRPENGSLFRLWLPLAS